VEGRHRFFRFLAPLLIVTGPLTSKGLTGKALGDLTLAWGFPTWYALILLLGMWLLLPLTRSQQTGVSIVGVRTGRAA
jgi:hypothetical protein